MSSSAVLRFHLVLLAFALLTPPPSVSARGLPLAVFPPSCSRIECPSYDVVENGNGYEIRRYNSAVWASASPVEDISFVNATRTGFLQLFNYIQGNNDYGERIEMTAPVITEVLPCDDLSCASSFVISFYVPKKNQENPPPAKGLRIRKWGTKYTAIRQFGGFVADESLGEVVAALYSALQSSSWASAVNKGAYFVAQYNSPFEFTDRVNEIWMTLDVADSESM